MNGITRRLKLTIGTFAIMIALTLTVAPVSQSGLGIQGASAEINTGDFASRAYFEKFCKNLGGTFDSGVYFSSCVLPDGHIYRCDETGKNCTFYLKRPTTGPLGGRINTGSINGTLTTTTKTNQTTSGALIVTKDE